MNIGAFIAAEMSRKRIMTGRETVESVLNLEKPLPLVGVVSDIHSHLLSGSSPPPPHKSSS